jgi:processive 1,2-diacylglycerol beta-glucosyltransferase
MAKGVYDALKGSGFHTHLETIRIDPLSETAYKAIYRFLPKLFKTTFKLGKYEFVGRVVEKYCEKSYFKLIEHLVKKYKPDVVMSSYLAFNSSAEKLKKRFGFKYLNVVSDPWTVTRIHFSQKGLNLVFDKHTMGTVKKHSYASMAVAVGWFVENKFNTKLTKPEARKILGINPNILTVCVTGGSEGTYDILKIVNSFVNLKHPVQILFMCGKNKQLYDLVSGFSGMLGGSNKIRIFPYKYTSKMNLYMNASDLVVGKAGPNTIFESVACGVPFFAVSHISGQEDGNLELIKKYNIGYAEENPIKIARILKLVIKKPSVLKGFNKSIGLLAQYNKGSQSKLLELLKN